MRATQIPFFPHRLNSNGSYDSICLTCFATIANAREVADLEVYDQSHVCDPLVLLQRGPVLGSRPINVRSM
jgi:hypothetical protein